MLNNTESKNIYSLTPMQHGILHHTLLETQSTVYHEQLILKLKGNLDLPLLELSWQEIFNHHAALQGRFLNSRVSNPIRIIPTYEILQIKQYLITDENDINISRYDQLPAEVENFLNNDLTQRFNLEEAPPMRLAVFSRSNNQHWLIWSFHHILLDKQSIKLVLDQVLTNYAKYVEDTSPFILPDNYISYQEWLSTLDKTNMLEYWKNCLNNFKEKNILALQRNATPACFKTLVSSEMAYQLRTISREQQVSLHDLLLSAWALNVGRYLDQQDVIIPTVLSGRSTKLNNSERTVGLLINTVPMRITWDSETNFHTLLQSVSKKLSVASENQYLSMAEIQSVTGRLPIDHIFFIHDASIQTLVGEKFAGLEVNLAKCDGCLPYELEMSITLTGADIHIELSGKQDEIWLQRLTDGFVHFLQALISTPTKPVNTLDYVDARQRSILAAWGDGGPSPMYGTLLQAFEAQLSNMPDAPGLIYDGITLSYWELDQRANQLANTILKEHLLSPNTPVAILAHRDANLLIAILAVLKTGAAYLLIDSALPEHRIKLMLEESKCCYLISSTDLISKLVLEKNIHFIDIQAKRKDAALTRPDVSISPEHLAYIIFTSGSTGIPKCVMVQHQNAAAFFAAATEAFGFTAGDRMLASTTVGFDIAALEILGSLCCGMTVVLTSEIETQSPHLLAEIIQKQQVNILQMTPTRLRLLLGNNNCDALANVHTVLVGGDPLPQALATQLIMCKNVRVFNVYGPTETTIWSTYWALDDGPISIGRALPGERIIILSSEQCLQPPGAIGEIAIAGVGVSKGYLNDTALTAEKFISLSDVDGMVYLTGDMGRWREDGCIEYLGRKDGQIKICDMRIEATEIEHYLKHLPYVEDVFVSTRLREEEIEIIAYIVSKEIIDAEAMQRQLANQLPIAMIPSSFIQLENIPRSEGLIDLQKLQNLHNTSCKQTRPATSPKERAINKIFATILGHNIGPDDDFFSAGGHSIQAVQAVGLINRELCSSYTLRDLYDSRSAASLATAKAEYTLPILKEPDLPEYPLTYAQQSLWILDQIEPGYIGHNQPYSYQLVGTVNTKALSRAWATIVAQHESLRTIFRTIDGMPRQEILENVEFIIERAYISKANDISQYINEFTCQKFDLSTGPLFRISLISIDAKKHILLFVIHKIICDDSSFALLMADLELAYEISLQGKNPENIPVTLPSLRYRDFAVWQQHYLNQPEAKLHFTYWRERLRDLPVLQISEDFSRKKSLLRQARQIEINIETENSQEWISELSLHNHQSIVTTVTLALLFIESNQTDIVIGSPITNKDHPELQNQIGLHSNTLPLRQKMDPSMTMNELCEACSITIAEAQKHADYPFARLIDELGLSAQPGRHSIFDTMLTYHQQPATIPTLEDINVSPYKSYSFNTDVDLNFEIWVDDKGVNGFIEYDIGIFHAQHILKLSMRWKQVLQTFIQNPAISLEDLRAFIAESNFKNKESLLAVAR